ncbi:hypothetical protein Bca4012_066844 [Brassica carinata]
MFEIQGQFLPHNKWIVVFTDDEGDMMLSGDRSMESVLQDGQEKKYIYIYVVRSIEWQQN